MLTDFFQCNKWKPFLPQVIQGGFNNDVHPVTIETAINNSRTSYAADGYFPQPGSTQLWQLGEELLPLIKKELDGLKEKFPATIIIG